MQTDRITSIAPRRISLFGGGTDVNPYAETFGGVCVNLAINLHTTVTIDPVFEVDVDSYDGSGGLGGSASLAVAAIGAMYKYLGIPIIKKQVADIAFNREISLGWHGGKQDQYSCAFGGFNVMTFKEDVFVMPMSKPVIEGFLPWMILFDTQIKRDSYRTQEGFKQLSKEQKYSLDGLKEIALRAIEVFPTKDYEEIGRLLDKTWDFKKKSNKVSNPELDLVYDEGKNAGAIGGKVMGAGQGGHFLFIVNPKEKKSFIKNMEVIQTLSGRKLKHVPFKVDYEGLQ